MLEGKRSSLVKPTLQTPFHIDFSWWSTNEREYRVHLRSLLTEEDLEAFADIEGDDLVDWVDPETAEVQQVDGLQHFLISTVAQREDFLQARTALVEAIFRLLLKNGNSPMSATEIGEELGRPPQSILRLLSGPRVYRGIRPIIEG
ncbi:MAG: hypothetical protein JXB38_11490 [Anaerolineales bacterium]|nr:hypothetical protein [Anaerolineales bacterium]